MDRPQIYLYDYIGAWDGPSAQTIVDQLDGYRQGDGVDVYINSVGGSVFEGLGIYSVLDRFPGEVIVHIDGLAASIASVIAQAGTERRISQAGMMMVHNPSWGTWGEADELRHYADVLDKMRDTIAGVYASRAGGSASDWAATMATEQWYTAAQALDAGLVDRVTESRQTLSVDSNGTLVENGLRSGTRTMVASIVKPKLSGLHPVNRSLKPTANGETLMIPGNVPGLREMLEDISRSTGKIEPFNQPNTPNAVADTNALTNRIKGFLGISNTADDLDTLDAARNIAKTAERVPELEATNATLLAERDKARADLAAASARIESMEQAEDARILDEAVNTFTIPAADRDQYATDLAENRAETRKLIDALPANAHKPGGGKGVEKPEGARNGDPVTLTRAEARIPKKYNEARAKARELKVPFEIVD